MDRNEYQVTEFINGILVATREGGVDRNKLVMANKDKLSGVATREGGVDRNKRNFC